MKLRGPGILIAGLAMSATLAAQSPAAVTFHIEDQRMQPSAYTITLHQDGSGHFHSVAGPNNLNDEAALPSEGQDRSIQIQPASAERIFAIAQAKKLFSAPCEDGGAHLAFTGKKTLAYEGPDGHGKCEFNFSKDTKIEWLTSEMQGIAATLEAGRRLELEHAHARLRLDAELEELETMVQNGQAVELGAIAPTLLSIVQDGAVMEHAQRRARHLLAIAEAGGVAAK